MLCERKNNIPLYKTVVIEISRFLLNSVIFGYLWSAFVEIAVIVPVFSSVDFLFYVESLSVTFHQSKDPNAVVGRPKKNKKQTLVMTAEVQKEIQNVRNKKAVNDKADN